MTTRLTLYGDFTCPWSYLASRRATWLAADGVEVDWRGVEHSPWHYRRPIDAADEFAALHAEMDDVLTHLLPGEELPYALAGHVPFTEAATSAYAEAYAAGVPDAARDVLFTAFWEGSCDLDDANVVRTLLVDVIREGHSSCEEVARWGLSVDATGGPISTVAWQLVHDWRDAWAATGETIVPTLLDDHHGLLVGEEAVDWLGAELVRRGIDVTGNPVPVTADRPPRAS